MIVSSEYIEYIWLRQKQKCKNSMSKHCVLISTDNRVEYISRNNIVKYIGMERMEDIEETH